ncbi:MAG: phosphoglucosamine mutase [Planctomycetota bacterium]
MAELIISVSGLRGIIGENLTPELAGQFAAAYAAGQGEGPIVLARDGRGTGPMLTDAVRATLLAVGRCVLDAEVAATPTLGVLVRHHHAAGGIQVSASHNPPQYNGIKLFTASGQVLPAQEGEKVVERFHQGRCEWVTYQHIGQAKRLNDTLSRHEQLVLDCVDPEVIVPQRFHVLLDSNHGAGSLLGQRLLQRLGCQLTLLGEQPDGKFSHPPEPIAENLAEVSQQVVAAAADIGFCQDPDADRLALIDETGRFIGEEYTVPICLKQVLQQRKGAVVTNCSTSRMSEDLANNYQVPFYRAPVGEANVVHAMKEREAVFGGEGNGGPIDPRVGYVRDSFVGMAWVLYAMARQAKPLSRLADELPRYSICKTKQQVDRPLIPAALEAIEKHFSDAQSSHMDGLRLDWDGKWLLVRASNTEPIVRIVAETGTETESEALCNEAARVIAHVSSR